MLAAFAETDTSFAFRLLSIVGIGVFILLAWLMSVDRKGVAWKTVAWGVALQFIFAVVVLHPSLQSYFFDAVNGAVTKLLSFAEEAAVFVFGSFADDGKVHPSFLNIACWIIIPTIIFFSSLMSLLYQLGIMQRIVYAIAWVMKRTMKTTGPESLSAAANIFVGQTEAPLVIKPYVHKMHLSELHAIMTGGFATVAGGVLALYVGYLSMGIPDIAGHLVAASIMSAPAALAVSKIMFPMPKDHIVEDDELTLMVEKPYDNVIEAAASGASEGVKLVVNVLAMLIAFIGLIAMLNWGIGLISISGEPLTLQQILGWIFSPIAFVMGVPWVECGMVGQLLGEKLILTELVAYSHLGEMAKDPEIVMSQRSAIICSYALCGFANFASIGIQIGGIGGIAPDRIKDLSKIGLRAMIGGSLAAFMTATIAGALIG